MADNLTYPRIIGQLEICIFLNILKPGTQERFIWLSLSETLIRVRYSGALKMPPLILCITYSQKIILITRVTNSSNEKIVNSKGRSGAAVTAASLAMSLSPNGTMLIS